MPWRLAEARSWLSARAAFGIAVLERVEPVPAAQAFMLDSAVELRSAPGGTPVSVRPAGVGRRRSLAQGGDEDYTWATRRGHPQRPRPWL